MSRMQDIQQQYKLHKQGLKWYVVPSNFELHELPYPQNFLSFFFKSNAQKLLKHLSSEFYYGYVFGKLERNQYEPI